VEPTYRYAAMRPHARPVRVNLKPGGRIASYARCSWPIAAGGGGGNLEASAALAVAEAVGEHEPAGVVARKALQAPGRRAGLRPVVRGSVDDEVAHSSLGRQAQQEIGGKGQRTPTGPCSFEVGPGTRSSTSTTGHRGRQGLTNRRPRDEVSGRRRKGRSAPRQIERTVQPEGPPGHSWWHGRGDVNPGPADRPERRQTAVRVRLRVRGTGQSRQRVRQRGADASCPYPNGFAGYAETRSGRIDPVAARYSASCVEQSSTVYGAAVGGPEQMTTAT